MDFKNIGKHVHDKVGGYENTDSIPPGYYKKLSKWVWDLNSELTTHLGRKDEFINRHRFVKGAKPISRLSDVSIEDDPLITDYVHFEILDKLLDSDFEAPVEPTILQSYLFTLGVFFNVCEVMDIPARGIIKICASAMKVTHNAALAVPLLVKSAQELELMSKSYGAKNKSYLKKKQRVLEEYHKIEGHQDKQLQIIAQEIKERIGSKRKDDPSHSTIERILRAELIVKDNL